MRPGKTNSEPVSGILLLAKKSGETSFSSLRSVKHALETGKVGHTGTLDSFADGLLVVLTGKLTRLVPHITSFDKNYLAVIQFGTETDTLDPTGKVVASSHYPTEQELRAVLPRFIGTIDQTPPLYSAVHINGKRASEIARAGKEALIPSRKIIVYSLTLLDFTGKYALVEVSCSKGTYIRSLARDIASACGSCAHLAALRRMSIGPFRLKDAVGSEKLADFTISSVDAMIEKSMLETKKADTEKNSHEQIIGSEFDEDLSARIISGVKPMSRELAFACGFSTAMITPDFVPSYINGRPLSAGYFVTDPDSGNHSQIAVFYPGGEFGGIMYRNGEKLSYGFVVPCVSKKFEVYSWEQVVAGKFSAEYKKQGTALTIGSFDGPHAGHESLFSAVLAQKTAAPGLCPLVPGIVTFSRSLRGLKDPSSYKGDVATLAQRLEIVASKGFAFAVVIDFSTDFGKMKGVDFLSVLAANCGMRFLAEGRDFHCGYQGATGMDKIRAFSAKQNFLVQALDPVMYCGERVSSSRIRESILAADFKPAADMLSRSFSIDCAGFVWTPKNEGGCEYMAALKSGIQVWPPEGSYDVVVILSGSGVSATAQTSVCVHTYNASCVIGSCDLRLQVPSGMVHGCVRAIQFGNPRDTL
jgi:tRNA pseudouridine55 synthase